MILMITFAMSILASIYIFFRLIKPLKLCRVATYALTVALVAMCFMFPLYMHMQHTETSLTYLVGSIGRIVVGFISFLFTFTIVKDIMFLLAILANRVVKYRMDPTKTVSRARMMAISVLIASIGSLSVGYYQSQNPTIVEVEIGIKDLPEALSGFKIVQISDLHVTQFTSNEWLAKVVDMVNNQRGDIVAVTGDLADLRMPDKSGALDLLAGLSARYGSYFVMGNHEFYGGQAPLKEERVAELGLTTLNNSNSIINHNGENILIGGVIDEQGIPFGYEAPNAAKSIESDSYFGASILLSHRPNIIADAASAGYDLQISGHTHGGQFFPWNLVVSAVEPHIKGHYRVDGAQLYVNQGVGFWGIPIKLGSLPEITVITLNRE